MRNIISKEPFGFQQIPPALIEKVYDKNGLLEKYIYNDGTSKRDIPINNILEITKNQLKFSLPHLHQTMQIW